MKQIDFYLDFVSPYAYLAFEQLPHALRGLSYQVRYRPILLAELLKRHGQLGPAEIKGKRDWIYRHVSWVAATASIELRLPPQHPFNPLQLLRLALACSDEGVPNRYQCETIFHHAWRSGAPADDPTRMEALTSLLNPVRDPQGAEVKQELRAATEAAVGAGLFGVPSMVVDGKLFWGNEGLPMLRAYLEGDEGLIEPWAAPSQVTSGVSRL